MAGDEYTFVMKAETDSIAATVVCVLVLYDIQRDTMLAFADNHPTLEPISTGIAIAQLADMIFVHSDYAIKVLERLYGVEFDRDMVTDTLSLSELLRGRGGNSIAKWAERLKIARDVFKGAEKWSPAVQRHAERDAKIVACVLENLLAQVPA
jgi:hypothetical protein